MPKQGEGYLGFVASTGGAYDADAFRALLSQMGTPSSGVGSRGGLVPSSGNYLQVLSPTGSSPQVRLTPVKGFVVADQTASGAYSFSFDDNKDTTLGRPGSGLTRVDRVVLRVNTSTGQITREVITGTAAASPDPAATQPPGGWVFLDLGYVTVPAGTVAVTATPSNQFLAVGTVPMTTVQREAAVTAGAVWPGMSVFDTTLGSELTWDGSIWHGLWYPYTPAWTQTGGTPLAIGNGTLNGYYRKMGRWVDVRIELTRGSTTNVGGAGVGYFWSLPVAAASATFGTGTGVGVRGTSEMPCIARLISQTVIALMRSADGTRLGQASGAWATGDSIQASIGYQTAA